MHTLYTMSKIDVICIKSKNKICHKAYVPITFDVRVTYIITLKKNVKFRDNLNCTEGMTDR